MPATSSLDVDNYTDEEIENDLNAFTLYRKDFDKAVVQAPPHQPSISIFELLNAPTVSNLGRLGSLPFELLSNICLMLDLLSAIKFGQASRHAREVTSNIRQFCQVDKYATKCVWLLLRTGLAPYITVSALHVALTTEACSFCNFFGGFILLPIAQRCCFLCIKDNDNLQPTYLTRLATLSGITPSRIRKLVPVMRSLPGTYSMEEKLIKRRHFVVAAQHAQEVLRAAGAREPDTWSERCILRFMAATSLPYLDPKTEKLQRGICCKGCYLAVNDAIFSEGYQERRDRLYSHDKFILHLRTCEDARDISLEQ